MVSSPLKYKWWILELFFPSELEESINWKLAELGLNRFAVKFSPHQPFKRTLLVWLPASDWTQDDRDDLVESLYALSEPFGLKFSDEPVWKKLNDEDWSMSWKKYWQPDPVGNQLLILPVWLDLPKQYSNRLIIRMDPGSAFGTGSHPTTRLCLEQLEREPPSSLSVADIGCGSGVLGFASLALGARKVYAVDTDSLAVHATTENAKINEICSDNLQVSLGSVEALQANLNGDVVDLLVCNILASVIEDLAPKFDRLISNDGKAVLSGLLCDQAPGIVSVFEELGWRMLSLIEKERWAMMVLCRAQNKTLLT